MNTMFLNCGNLTDIDLSGFDTSKVTGMAGMFNGCSTLTSLDLSGGNFDTSNVSAINFMFNNCSGLLSLNLSGFDTSSASACPAFDGCTSLTEIILSNAVLNNPNEDMVLPTSLQNIDLTSAKLIGDCRKLFYNHTNLVDIDMTDIDTSEVTDMSHMFEGCSGLTGTSLDVSNFNTSAVTNMSHMFAGCSNITSLDVSNFNTSAVTDMSDMFFNCSNITSLDVSSFDTSSVTDMTEVFRNCNSIIGLDLSNFDTSSVTHMTNLFCECGSLASLNLSGFDTSNVMDLNGMFEMCSDLINIDLSNSNLKNPTNIPFSDNLKQINLSNSKLIGDCTDLFNNLGNLEEINMTDIDTSEVTNMAQMFSNCFSLISLDLSSFDTSNVTSMTGMFEYSSSLERIYYDGAFDTTALISSTNMFFGCSAINGSDITSYDSSKVDATYARVATATQNGYFTPPSRTVSFNTMGGSLIADAIVPKGSVVTRPTNPTKSDYVFGNWYKEEACTNLYDFTTPVTTDITLYAKWAPAICTVIFNTMGGSSIANALVNNGQKVIKPANPTKSGVTFVNWYKEETYENVYDFNTPVTDNITLYAKWNIQWTVTFNTMGGSSIADVIVNDGQKVTKPANPTMSGWKFVNWYKEAALVNVYNFNAPVISNITLYAKWKSASSSGGGGGGGSDNVSAPKLLSNNGIGSSPQSSAKLIKERISINEIPVTKDMISWVHNNDGTWELDIHVQDVVLRANSIWINVVSIDNETKSLIQKAYYFDEKSKMFTGWGKDIKSNYYYLEPERTVNEGLLAIGWKKVGGVYYYLNSEGKLLVNSTTPDGYFVGADGSWIPQYGSTNKTTTNDVSNENKSEQIIAYIEEKGPAAK